MKPEKLRTPTDTLMEAMQSFSEDEPRDCIVIYTTQAGDLAWHSSTDSTSHKIGLLETAKFWVLENMKNKDASA
jgi:hypothetical protein